MVAVLAVLTITVCILVDWALQLIRARRARSRARRLALCSASQLWRQPVSDPMDPPLGVFFHRAHSWAVVEANGYVRIGLDGLIGLLMGQVDRVELPAPGQQVREGEDIAYVLQNNHRLRLAAPIGGTVVRVNRELQSDGIFIPSEPYGTGWVCEIRPESLSKDLKKLMIADQAVAWHIKEIERASDFFSLRGHGETGLNVGGTRLFPLGGLLQGADDDEWREFQNRFLGIHRGRTSEK